jgi:hypothetical protein
MKRRILIAGMACIAVFGLILAANWQVVSMLISRPYMGSVSESWETSNRTFRLRINRHSEENAWVGGAYYVFQSARSDSESWHEIMTFRHDDPNPIPRDQVRFLNDQVAFVFMGWMYAVTTDDGRSWSVWNAEKDLPKWDCCNYRLISTVNIDANGTGTMILSPIPQRQGEVPALRTKDFGQHWSL